MKYLISLYTWYGFDVWQAEFENHAEMVSWYKNVKHDIENDPCSKDYIYKVKIKSIIK